MSGIRKTTDMVELSQEARAELEAFAILMARALGQGQRVLDDVRRLLGQTRPSRNWEPPDLDKPG